MKTRGSGAAIGAAFFVTAAAITVGGTDIAAAVECSGPFKQCAIEIGAFCEIENGKLMIWYKDREGTSHRFEQFSRWQGLRSTRPPEPVQAGRRAETGAEAVSARDAVVTPARDKSQSRRT